MHSPPVRGSASSHWPNILRQAFPSCLFLARAIVLPGSYQPLSLWGTGIDPAPLKRLASYYWEQKWPSKYLPGHTRGVPVCRTLLGKQTSVELDHVIQQNPLLQGADFVQQKQNFREQNTAIGGQSLSGARISPAEKDWALQHNYISVLSKYLLFQIANVDCMFKPVVIIWTKKAHFDMVKYKLDCIKPVCCNDNFSCYQYYDKYPKAKPTNAERRHFCLHGYYSSYTTSLTSISNVLILKITSPLPQEALKALCCWLFDLSLTVTGGAELTNSKKGVQKWSCSIVRPSKVCPWASSLWRKKGMQPERNSYSF